MPTYRYECSSCEKIHEIFHSISEDPREKCPDCGGSMSRLIGAGGGVILKGDGFYTTDYRSDSYKKEAKKEKESGKSASESKNSKPASDSASARKPSKKKGKNSD